MAQTNSKKPGRVPIYKDINLSFIQHPKTGDISTVSDEEAIKRSVRHLVMTRFEERQFEPEIGSTIINLLFEPKTPFTMLFISDSIKRVINNFEPRVKLLDVVVDDQTDQHYYDVTILYEFQNKETEVTFNLELERVR